MRNSEPFGLAKAVMLLLVTALVAAAPIERGALSPYTAKNYPDIWARWGATGVARIERARSGAAKIMARDPNCDAVAAADIAELQSLPPDVIVLFAMCENGYRRNHISEEQALAAR